MCLGEINSSLSVLKFIHTNNIKYKYKYRSDLHTCRLIVSINHNKESIWRAEAMTSLPVKNKQKTTTPSFITDETFSLYILIWCKYFNVLI